MNGPHPIMAEALAPFTPGNGKDGSVKLPSGNEISEHAAILIQALLRENLELTLENAELKRQLTNQARADAEMWS